MFLPRLLGALSPQAFLDQHYHKLPLAMAGGCRDLCSLGSWETVRAILACEGADVLVGRGGEAWPGQTPGPDQARGLLEQGYTIGIRHAERQHAGLAELAAEFAADFAAPVDVHLYVTPAEQAGFGWHYDAEDVFILQTAGSKQWSLRKNTVNPWPLMEALPQDMRYRAELMPLLRCNLNAGDWLYIPNGYWHSTQAAEESISLSIGMKSPSPVDLLDALRPRLLDSLRWRQRLPPAGRANVVEDEQLIQQYQGVLADAAKELAALLVEEQFLRTWLDQARKHS